MEPRDFLSYLPEGASLVGVLICVWLFLKDRASSQSQYEAHLERMSSRFDAAIRSVTEAHSSALRDLAARLDRHTETEAAMHVAMQRLIDRIDEIVRRLNGKGGA